MIRSFWKENDIEDEAHNEVANTKRAKVFREHEQDEDAKLGRKRRNSLIDEEDWPIPRSSVFEATKSEEPTEHQQDFKRFNSGEKMEIEDEEGGGHFAMGLHEKDFLHEYTEMNDTLRELMIERTLRQNKFFYNRKSLNRFNWK